MMKWNPDVKSKEKKKIILLTCVTPYQTHEEKKKPLGSVIDDANIENNFFSV